MSVPCKVIATKRQIVNAQDKVLWNLKILQRSSDVLLADIGKAISEGSSQYFVLWGHVHIYMYISTFITVERNFAIFLLRFYFWLIMKILSIFSYHGKHKLKQKLYTEIVFIVNEKFASRVDRLQDRVSQVPLFRREFDKELRDILKVHLDEVKKKVLGTSNWSSNFFDFLCKSHNFLHSNISDFVP